MAFIEHGLSGDKNENHMIILEEELSKRGLFVVNIDATDSLNESESSPEGITFTGRYNDLCDVIEWARGQEWFREPFALAGQSMGAAAVLLYAQNYPESVNLLLPVSLPWLTGKSRGVLWGDDEMAKWKADGFYDKVSKSRGRTLRIPYNFYMDLERYDFVQNAGKITARTVLIIGDREDERRLDWNRAIFNELKCNKDFIVLPNTPHIVAKTPENAKTFRGALERALDQKREKDVI